MKTDDIARIYQPKRYALSPKTTITLAHLLAAREDLSKIIRTSSGSSREKTACAINKVGFSFNTVENESLISSFGIFMNLNSFFLCLGELDKRVVEGLRSSRLSYVCACSFEFLYL